MLRRKATWKDGHKVLTSAATKGRSTGLLSGPAESCLRRRAGVRYPAAHPAPGGERPSAIGLCFRSVLPAAACPFEGCGRPGDQLSQAGLDAR